MAVDDLNLFPDEDLPQYREGRKHRWKGRRTVHYPVRKVVDFESIRQVSNSTSIRIWRSVGMRDDYDPMATINQLLSIS